MFRRDLFKMKSVLLLPLFFLLSSIAIQKVEGSVDSLIDDGSTNKTKGQDAVVPTTYCGEGEDKGIHKCVPYYMCNSSWVLSDNDDFVDIRIQDDRFSCDDNIVRVCCKMSDVLENR